jgi:hypothetical protein
MSVKRLRHKHNGEQGLREDDRPAHPRLLRPFFVAQTFASRRSVAGLLIEGIAFSKEKLTTHFTESKHIFVGGQTETLRDDFALEDLFTIESGGSVASKVNTPRDVLCDGQIRNDVVTQGEQRK